MVDEPIKKHLIKFNIDDHYDQDLIRCKILDLIGKDFVISCLKTAKSLKTDHTTIMQGKLLGGDVFISLTFDFTEDKNKPNENN